MLLKDIKQALRGVVMIMLSLYEHSHPCLPEDVTVKFDLGCVGILKGYPKLKVVLPFKRKGLGRGKVGGKVDFLSEVQKAFNGVFVSEWVVSEHSNSLVKEFQIWGGEFRNRLSIMMLCRRLFVGL
jgi:hypothetical protein